jgi:predicted transcriptional regulator
VSVTTDYTAMHRAFRDVGEGHGLHPTAVRVVLALDEHGLHETVTGLGARLGLHDTAVHRALRQLRAGGFVDRDDVPTESGRRVAWDVVDAERGVEG